MATKTKFKLKKKFKRYLISFIFIFLLTFLGFNLVNSALYRETLEYKLKQKGYDEASILAISKLDEKEQAYILENEKIDYIKYIIGAKYYLDKNFYKYLEYYEENSKIDYDELIALVNTHANYAWYENTSIADTENKQEVLVNKYFVLPDDYDPGTIKKFSATYAYGDVYAEETCYNAFIEMANAAKRDGVTLILTSGYRSHESQASSYENIKNQKGQSYADENSIRPGHSETETGLALTILTYSGVLETFETTEAYAWLHEHAQDYGFIERFQKGQEHITGYEAKPWYFRYVGVELAQKIKEEGITFEEYYAYYMEK